jgi:hypothetical protein
MSNAFTNFLGGVTSGVFGNSADLKDYQHANRLYVRDTYARAPKISFLYFVSFNINKAAVKDKQFLERKNIDTVGLLVKRIDLPKFAITTETLNQYNRKTVIQTKLNYSNISIDFHDDNSDITTNLWKNYYKYYYVDSTYSDIGGGKIKKNGIPVQFTDTKYGQNGYSYGFDNFQNQPFFNSIDIYVLHQKKFTQTTLVNPLIVDWNHDSLNQDDANRPLANKMTLAYETVLYNQGKIIKGSSPEGFAAIYYDTSPSPLSIGGNGTKTLFGPGGVIDGAASIFGENGSLANAKSPLDYLGVAIQTNNLVKNTRQLSKSGVKYEGYSILSGVLGNIQATGNQPGGVGAAAQAGLSQQGSGVLGNIGINLFSEKNTSVNGTTQAVPSTLTTKR